VRREKRGAKMGKEVKKRGGAQTEMAKRERGVQDGDRGAKRGKRGAERRSTERKKKGSARGRRGRSRNLKRGGRTWDV
jgi:hypothetical protein